MLLIESRVSDFKVFNNVDLRNISVIIYLITSIYYYRIDSKEKNAEIQDLKAKLKSK